MYPTKPRKDLTSYTVWGVGHLATASTFLGLVDIPFPLTHVLSIQSLL